MGFGHTCLEFTVERGRVDEERSSDSEECRILERRRPAKDHKRFQL